MQLCSCPRSTALADIPVADCFESFGQIQKFAIQRLRQANGTLNGFVMPTTSPLVKASWTPLLTAADSTKIIVSPYVQAPVAEGGAARTFGGGNETVGGVEEIIGREPTPFTGVFRKLPQNIIKAMKTLTCEEIGVYLFDENGAIGAIRTGATPNFTYRPIPIRSFFVGDKTLGGLEAPDSNAVSWQFPPNWSDDLVLLAPTDFNPLIDLVVVAEEP